ncbi:pilus assembly protein PilM [Chloroflexota bacterium]
MITLEISSTDIKLLETSGNKVVKWATRALEPGIFDDEAIAEPQALGDAVKQLMESSGIRGNNIAISVSGLYSLSRVLLVRNPTASAVTRQAVMDAAAGVIPIAEDDFYVSWQTIAVVEGGHQVLVTSVPRDMIDGELQALKMGGIKPRLLDLKTMALARAVNRENALILNIEPTTFDIVIIVDGRVEGMHTTAWEQYGVTPEEMIDTLIIALESTIGFYNSHHVNFTLDLATPMFITGQMSGDLALVEGLQSKVEHPVEPFTPPLEYPAHMLVSQYAVNIGLAMKKVTKGKAKSSDEKSFSLPDINLLPEAYKPWKPNARQIYLAMALFAVMALVFPLYQATADAMHETAVLETRYNGVNALLTQRQAEIASRQPLQQVVNRYETIVDMGGGYTADMQVIIDEAEELDVRVSTVAHVGNTITVSCQTDSYITFRSYLAALAESGRFSTPIPPPEGYPYIKGGTIKLEPVKSE